MPFGRLLLTALFLCSLPAFSQDQALISGKISSNAQQSPDLRTPPAATPSEPWKIIPQSDKDKDLIVITPEMDRKGIVVSPEGPLAADTTCYAIRSYVVKRDSKDSDSVHPVGYSTCLPATRYRLKTADAAAAMSLTK